MYVKSTSSIFTVYVRLDITGYPIRKFAGLDDTYNIVYKRIIDQLILPATHG